MTRPRDLFRDFERMQREVDEVFGARREASAPAVDVFYVKDPPRAIVQVELPGVDPDEVTLEVRGRELVLAGARRPPQAGGGLNQLVDMQHGPFRRVIGLGADVVADEAKASYRDGILEITLPLVPPERRRRSVPVTERDRNG